MRICVLPLHSKPRIFLCSTSLNCESIQTLFFAQFFICAAEEMRTKFNFKHSSNNGFSPLSSSSSPPPFYSPHFHIHTHTAMTRALWFYQTTFHHLVPNIVCKANEEFIESNGNEASTPPPPPHEKTKRKKQSTKEILGEGIRQLFYGGTMKILYQTLMKYLPSFFVLFFPLPSLDLKWWGFHRTRNVTWESCSSSTKRTSAYTYAFADKYLRWIFCQLPLPVIYI